MKELKELRLLGLNKFEGEAYKAVVKLGKGSALRMASTAGIPYGRIYDVMESLISKGLVRMSPEKPKIYSPTDPSSLKILIRKKIQDLQDLDKEVDKLKKMYEMKPQEAVWLSRGKENFRKIMGALPAPKKYEYAIKYTSEFNPVWARSVKKSVAEGKDVRTLARYDEETKEDVRKWLKISKKVREFENEGIAVDIIDDDLMVVGLIKSDVTLSIRDKTFIRMMKSLFLSQWERSKNVV